ncbi:MAG TPA: AAA family ATPase [Hyphomicrobiaceae bacterium]|jgi:succinoglycan biosynthesis transport protein ExoP|nr:AAA family ATPase [Hyphomicrobiaceae bacterium]
MAVAGSDNLVVMGMLHVKNRQAVGYPHGEERSPLELIDFFRGVLRQQLALILSVAFIAIVLGALYLWLTPPMYTARATMIIDRGKVQAQLGGMSRELPLDTVEVESQIQLIRSEGVALAVAKALKLDADPEFTGPPTGVGGRIHELLSRLTSGDSTDAHIDPFRLALGRLDRNLTVNRVGGYIIQIEYRSLRPERAAEVANAFADFYIQDQLNSRAAAARQAATWLQDRMQKLSDQSALADEAIVQFKTKNNIVAAGGRLINDQQLSELNTQLVLAREKAAETKARLDRIEEITRAGSPDGGAVADTLNNPIIVKLRSQYLELTNREADWSRRFGKDHFAVLNLQRQIREIRNSISDELRRIAETYKSDYEIARQRLAEIEKTVAAAVSRSQEANQAQIELRQLESSADTYRGLYKSALQRNTELVQQQSFPGTEARLVTRASVPAGKSSPKTLIILFVSTVGGLIAGLGVGVLRAALDRVFHTPGQVEELLQTNCLALVPALKSVKASASRPPAPRTIARERSVAREVVDRPLSRFAEAMRSIKSAADLSRHSIKVLAFTSSVPNEGKSTIAAAFALLAAQTKARVVLVDCDFRNPSLTATLAPGAEDGIVEVISRKKALEEALWKDPATSLNFLPGSTTARVADSSEILASAPLRALFGELREKFDWVIVDLPPVAPIVDVQSTAGLADSYVLVVEWATTRIEVTELALSKASVIHDKLLGAVLNKVNFKILRRHEGHRGDYYSDKYYAQYGDAGV